MASPSQRRMPGPVHRTRWPRWPEPDDPGLLIGEAATLLGTTVKAIRVYHDRGLLPEPERDESGYRRYRAAELVALARITRLRAVGLSLREIAPLVHADDGGAGLRQALSDLDDALAAQVIECERRRALLELLLDEGIDDPVAVSAADVWEERSIALLREAIPDLTPEQELLERRFARALAALVPDTWTLEGDAGVEQALAALGVGGESQSEFASQHRRFYALAGVDPDDPRVTALASDLLAMLRDLFSSLPADPEATKLASVDGERSRQAMRGLAAALDVLAPAQRRVMELVLPELFQQPTASSP